jgi:hypothetical protein
VPAAGEGQAFNALAFEAPGVLEDAGLLGGAAGTADREHQDTALLAGALHVFVARTASRHRRDEAPLAALAANGEDTGAGVERFGERAAGGGRRGGGGRWRTLLADALVEPEGEGEAVFEELTVAGWENLGAAQE